MKWLARRVRDGEVCAGRPTLWVDFSPLWYTWRSRVDQRALRSTVWASIYTNTSVSCTIASIRCTIFYLRTLSTNLQYVWQVYLSEQKRRKRKCCHYNINLLCRLLSFLFPISWTIRIFFPLVHFKCTFMMCFGFLQSYLWLSFDTDSCNFYHCIVFSVGRCSVFFRFVVETIS